MKNTNIVPAIMAFQTCPSTKIPIKNGDAMISSTFVVDDPLRCNHTITIIITIIMLPNPIFRRKLVTFVVMLSYLLVFFFDLIVDLLDH